MRGGGEVTRSFIHSFNVYLPSARCSGTEDRALIRTADIPALKEATVSWDETGSKQADRVRGFHRVLSATKKADLGVVLRGMTQAPTLRPLQM